MWCCINFIKTSFEMLQERRNNNVEDTDEIIKNDLAERNTIEYHSINNVVHRKTFAISLFLSTKNAVYQYYGTKL